MSVTLLVTIALAVLIAAATAGFTSRSRSARTAVITLTHDSKLDDPAITEALAGDCFYLGCLGSKKTHAARLARLEAAVQRGRLAGRRGICCHG